MVTINTALGEITGIEKDNVLTFRGVRYAESPAGKNRFLPPVPASKWEGVNDATQFPNRCYQPPTADILGPPAPGEESEDCLFLNIATPSVTGDPRPVLFWIHGGSFTMGSANEYNGSVLAAQGNVVVVTINYRLGLLGFLDLSSYGDEYAGSASNGIRDQICALKWVRDNIADYGGDPDNVTIFGESAGGASVHCILAAPSADGLYHRAIAHSPGTANTPPDDLTPVLSAHLGVDQKDLAEKLKSMKGSEILAAQIAANVSGGSVIDGTVITRSTNDAVLERGENMVPLIAGSNHDEGTLFTTIMPDENIYGFMGPILASMTMAGNDPTTYISALKEAYPEDDAKTHYERIWVDMFRRSSIQSTERATKAGPGGWLYRFDLPSNIPGLGATHASEISFTFNNYANPDEIQLGFYDREDPVVKELALKWSNTIIAFAKTGDPNGAGLPLWPKYSEEDRQTLILDDNPRVESDLDELHQKLWGDR